MPAVRRTASLETRETGDWETCCDSASCQARTVRPASQLTVPSRRPPSRESTGSSEWGWLRPNSQCRLEGMEQFQRSLRLIGLRPEDLGLMASPHNQPQFLSSTKAIDMRRAKPTLCTRLNKRTVSADDLRTLLEECPVKDSVKREMVAKAVYEEWYFKKEQEVRRKKEMQRDLENSKLSYLQIEKREQLEKNQIKFSEWLKEKAAKKREQLSNPPTDKKNLGKRTMSNPEQAEAAFITWKQSKEKQLQSGRKSSLNNVDQQFEMQSKRLEAEKAFQHWKEKKEEELQKLMKEKERLDALMKEDQRRIKEQKIKESEISFRVWKLKKDRELQEKANKVKTVEERKKMVATKAVEERRSEANQAFLEWLDSVEQRERQQCSVAKSCATPRETSRRQSPVRSSSRASSRASSPGQRCYKALSLQRPKPARNKGN